jgi:hypothetical protein
VGKARSLPYSVAPQSFFNRVGSCFTNRHWTRLEKLALGKHSSLLQKFVNYGRKKFYNIGPRSWFGKSLLQKPESKLFVVLKNLSPMSLNSSFGQNKLERLCYFVAALMH